MAGAHAAFPTTGNRNRDRSFPLLPATSDELLQLILHTTGISDIRNILIPHLQSIVDGEFRATLTSATVASPIVTTNPTAAVAASGDAPVTGVAGVLSPPATSAPGALTSPSPSASTSAIPISASQTKKERGEEIVTIPGFQLGELSDQSVEEHTAALVFVVSARMKRSTRSAAGRGGISNLESLQFATRLCLLGDPDQFLSCPARVTELAWNMVRHAQYLNNTQSILRPLASLLQRGTLPGCFSGVRAAFAECCILSGAYADARPMLEDHLIDARSLAANYLDLLTYFHHGGMIYAVLGDFKRAVEFFSFAVSMPTQAVSAIQVSCAKRAILAEILNTGLFIRFPKYISTSVSRVIERGPSGYGEYEKLAKAFEAEKWDDVKDMAKGSKKVFQKDCNEGLVDKIVESITKRRILKLRETYSRLTLAQLAGKCGLSEAETQNVLMNVLSDMIANNEVRAIISTDSSPIVTFLEDEHVGSGNGQAPPASLDAIRRSLQVAEVFERELNRCNKHLGLNKAWLAKQASALEPIDGPTGINNTLGLGRRRDDVFSSTDIPTTRTLRGVGSNLNDTGF